MKKGEVNDLVNKKKKNNYCKFKIGNYDIKISFLSSGKLSSTINGRSLGDNKSSEKLIKKLTNPDEKDALSKAFKEISMRYPQINTNLHLNLSPSSNIIPGNVYIKTVDGRKIRKHLLNYFDDNSIKINKDKNKCLQINDLKRVKFIEMEVSPVCDYAQNKMKKYRFISGILIPNELFNKLNKKNYNNSYNFYEVKPVLLLNGSINKIIFDFRYLKTFDLSEADQNYTEPMFRAKTELFSDILSNLSAFINRPGITFLS